MCRTGMIVVNGDLRRFWPETNGDLRRFRIYTNGDLRYDSFFEKSKVIMVPFL